MSRKCKKVSFVNFAKPPITDEENLVKMRRQDENFYMGAMGVNFHG